ncbi:MAG TPA: NADPH-dependent F420 reductase [Acidimicrobiales bacterium]|nr:NADPH-dependent F420 reductase [Acidimicrobiales bacterium]
MHVGILGGTGPAGRGLAVRLGVAGTEVTIGSRDATRGSAIAEELNGRWSGRGLSLAGGDNEAAAAADLVVVATPWDAAIPTVRPLADALAGKVVISVVVALERQGKEMVALTAPRGSMAAAVAAHAPGAKVAAAMHHLPASEMENLEAGLAADVLVCSDDPAATEATIDLIASIEGLRPLDAGSLAQAGAVEAFTAVLISLNIRYKAHSTLRLGGL